MPTLRTRSTIAATLIALLCTAATTLAGPLNPPGGAIAATGKTLTEVEPRTAINAANTPGDANSLFRITQPGSYYLAGNVTGVSGKTGIEIAASNVTIDLGGFTMTGVAGSLSGIAVSTANLTAITVRDGTLRSWGGSGLDLVALAPRQLCVERINSTGNTAKGIRVFENSTVRDCTALSNGGLGFDIYSYVTLTGCRADSNSDTGIDLGGYCTVSGCESTRNAGTGISTSSSCTIEHSTSSQNSSHGIVVSAYCTVRECTVSSNVLAGIQVPASSLISRNTVTGNGASGGPEGGNSVGIYVYGNESRIEDNWLSGNNNGFLVTGVNNNIVRNSVRGSAGPWEVAAGNRCHVILWGPGGPVVGASGGTAPSSSDPLVNITY